MFESPEDVVHRFADLLGAAGISYMLTGSFAGGFFGVSRATQDIDLVISPSIETLQRFVGSLDPERYYVSEEAALSALQRESLFNVIDHQSGWKIDLICRKSRAFSVEEFARRSARSLAGADIVVASPEDVILAKLESSKLGGSERQFQDAASILKVQGDALDQEYLDHWATELGLAEQLAAVRLEVGD